jgi:hypothetical protein
VGACGSTNPAKNEINRSSKNIKKTWNFPTRAPVGLCKQLELITFQLTVKRQVNPEHFQQGNRPGHNSDRYSDPLADRWSAGFPTLQKLGLWPVGYHRRRAGSAVDSALAWQDLTDITN